MSKHQTLIRNFSLRSPSSENGRSAKPAQSSCKLAMRILENHGPADNALHPICGSTGCHLMKAFDLNALRSRIDLRMRRFAHTGETPQAGTRNRNPESILWARNLSQEGCK